jgi:hypothetical protein
MTLNQIALHCGVNWSTVKRWVTDGVKGRKLKSIQLGGRTLVTPEAFAGFIAAETIPHQPGLVQDKLTDSLAQLAALGVRTNCGGKQHQKSHANKGQTSGDSES